jgi:tetratricopeptide (TPR) repeat protein
MKIVNLAKFAASGLVLGAMFGGLAPFEGGVSSASAQADPAVNAAALAAKKAQKAAAKGQMDKAVSFAEAAVSYQPQDMRYRLLLGETYLTAGRFQSAEASFNDVLDLSPGHDRASLKLALTKIALGKIDAAKSIINDVKDRLAPADYALALTLAGDTETAISTLENEVRANGSDARGRQNLALAYAFAGKWAQARVLASQDLSPDLVDARMTQWAALARPQASWDQVASVLGVKAVYDNGQPVALALNSRRSDPVQVAVAPVEAPVEVAAVEVAAVEPAVAYEAPAPVEVAVASVAQPKFVYEMGPRREIVQRIPDAAPVAKAAARFARAAAPTPLVRAQAKPMKTALAVPKPVKSSVASKPATGAGQFVVQLGAFGSQVAAKTMWTRLASKVDPLGSRKAVTATVGAKGKTLHRLAASGFATMMDAQAVCGQVKAAGGQCFVRSSNAVTNIRWAALQTGKAVQLASR